MPTDASVARRKDCEYYGLQEQVTQVDWTFFEQNILPPLPSGIDLDAITRKLVQEPAAACVQGEHHWTSFTLGAPGRYGIHEDKVFSDMVKIVSAIEGEWPDQRRPRGSSSASRR